MVDVVSNLYPDFLFFFHIPQCSSSISAAELSRHYSDLQILMSVIQSLFKLLSWIAIVATTVVDLGKNVSADERF